MRQNIALGILTAMTFSVLWSIPCTDAKVTDAECEEWCGSDCENEPRAARDKCTEVQLECSPSQCTRLGRSYGRSRFRNSFGSSSSSSSTTTYSSSSSGGGSYSSSSTTTYRSSGGGASVSASGTTLGLIIAGVLVVLVIVGVVVYCMYMKRRSRRVGAGGYGHTGITPSPITPVYGADPYGGVASPYGGAPNPYGGVPNPYGGVPSPYGGAPSPYTGAPGAYGASPAATTYGGANTYAPQTYGV